MSSSSLAIIGDARHNFVIKPDEDVLDMKKIGQEVDAAICYQTI